MQNDTFNFSDGERLKNNMFNQLVQFGKAYAPNVPPASEEEFLHHIFAKHQIKSEQFIKLFVQSMLLHAFLSHRFPNNFLEQRVRSVVKYALDRLCENSEAIPSINTFIVDSLLDMMEQALQDLCTKIQQGQGIPKNKTPALTYEECKDTCQAFLNTVRQSFQEAQDILSNGGSSLPLTDAFLAHCLRFFHIECEYGRSWAARFFEYNQIHSARIDLKYFSSQEKHYLNIQTLYDDQERFIECTISPCLSIEEFIKIPLYIFHEYISHLCANIYRSITEDEKQKKAGIRAFKHIWTALDEGWMVHTAKIFLEDKMYELLLGKREHLQYTTKLCVEDWIGSMHYAYKKDEAYIEQARAGAEMAEEFLTFLRYEICNGDEGKAKKLYYRLSFDLISHTLSLTFNHTQFTTNISLLYQKKRSFLIQAVQESIDTNEYFINIDFLWYCVKDYRLAPP